MSSSNGTGNESHDKEMNKNSVDEDATKHDFR